MGKRGAWISGILLGFLLMYACPLTVLADTGPKPSVMVDFVGIEADTYYVTLLSETSSTGPWNDGDYLEWFGEREIWEKFTAYAAEDDFYFLGNFAECGEEDVFVWNYYPPERFKILMYFPGQEDFWCSEVYERYAFDSYYRVTVEEGQQNTVDVERSYDYRWELVSLFCRIVITILLELGVAWIFRFREKRQVLFIAVTNIVTNVVLNVTLNLIQYAWGSHAFVFHYVWMELLVFVLEGGLYASLLMRFAKEERHLHPWLYALTANVVSFVGGLILAQLIPGIF